MERFDEQIPIYLQISGLIKKQISRGDLKSGDKLKSVRELALEMGVNPNTVQRALASLENEELLFAERTTGRFVTKNNDTIERMRREMLMEKVTEFVQSMKELGYTGRDILSLIEEQVGGENK